MRRSRGAEGRSSAVSTARQRRDQKGNHRRDAENSEFFVQSTACQRSNASNPEQLNILARDRPKPTTPCGEGISKFRGHFEIVGVEYPPRAVLQIFVALQYKTRCNVTGSKRNIVMNGSARPDSVRRRIQCFGIIDSPGRPLRPACLENRGKPPHQFGGLSSAGRRLDDERLVEGHPYARWNHPIGSKLKPGPKRSISLRFGPNAKL